MVFWMRCAAPGQIQMKPITTEKNKVVSNLVLIKITISHFLIYNNMRNVIVSIREYP